MTHSLTLGSLLLTDSFPDADNDFKFDVLAEGVGFGVAEGVKDVVSSLLADGDLIRTTRYGNREVSFVVEITGPDLASLAHGEAALRREVGRGNTLTWQPPDDFAVPTVFEVVDSEMSQRFDDLDELGKRRRFTLTLTCGPFARSAELVTVEAIAPPSSETSVTLSTADSTTGWSTYSPGTIGATGGYVYSSEFSAGYGESVHYLTLAAASSPATPYVVVEWWSSFPVVFTPTLVDAPAVVSRRMSDGWTLTVYDTTGRTFAALPFRATLAGTGGQYRIRDVKRTDTVPQVTKRQISRTIIPGGTERTPASIHVKSSDGVTGNGLSIVHTSPAAGNGFAPDLTRWRVSGNGQTTDTNTFSGKTEPIQPSAFLARLPITSVETSGYLLCAVMKSNTVGTFPINWAVDSFISGAASGVVTDFRPTQFYATNQWHFCSIALVTLPTVQAVSGQVSVVLWYQGSSATITLDEAWLLPVNDDSALTVVNGASAHLWLDSPSVTTGSQPKVWTGSAADRSNQYHPGSSLFAPGNHVLHPDGTTVFVATNGADNPAVSSTHYPRWHSNAAE